MMDKTIENDQNMQKSHGNEGDERIRNKSEELLSLQVQSQQKQMELPSKNNFKWTYEEHAKYIYFLELNKTKIKSKLIRKSNAFFKEMEKFILTKTALQCRSHHQKFQERYKFPHRIITGEKKYIPTETYKSVVQTAKFTDFINNNQNGANNNILTAAHREGNLNKKEYVTASCQTQICDVEKKIYTEAQIQQPVAMNYMFPFPQMYMYYHPYPNIY